MGADRLRDGARAGKDRSAAVGLLQRREDEEGGEAFNAAEAIDGPTQDGLAAEFIGEPTARAKRRPAISTTILSYAVEPVTIEIALFGGQVSWQQGKGRAWKTLGPTAHR